MKIRCPKCQKEIELGVSKFPPMGLEVVCPSCDAKFRMKSKGRAAPITGDAPAMSEAPAPAAPAPEALAPAPPAPAAPAPAAPAEDDFDALDDLADLFDEIEQLSAEEPAAATFYVQSVSGKTFGPLTVDAIKQMIQTGQLKGYEPLSADERSWRPMIEWDDFKDVATAPPVEEQEPEWLDEAPADPAPAPAPRPVVSGAPAPARAPIAASDGAAPVGQPIGLPGNDAALPSEPSAPYQTVSRPSPRRIRSALKDEVLEGGDQSEGIDIKDPKIIGGGVVLLLLVGVLLFLLFSSGGSTKNFAKVSFSFKKPYATDSHTTYLKKMLPKINRQLKKQPGHPQLQLYKALVLAMYLEHHRPDRSRYNRFKRAFKQVRPPAEGEKPSFHYLWLLAQRAVLQRKALSVLRLSQAMLKKRPNSSAALYLRGKAFALSGRRARALKTFEQVAARMSEPARVYYAKALVLAAKPRRKAAKKRPAPRRKAAKKAPAKGAKAPAKGKKPAKRPAAPAKKPAKQPTAPVVDTAAQKKRMEDALQAFYKTYLITKDHYPAYFGVIGFDGKLPEHKQTISKAWEKLTPVISRVPNRQARVTFYTMRYHRARRLGKPAKALAWLKKAQKFGNSPTLRKLLPKAYLATHNYAMVWSYLKSKMKRTPGKKPSFEPVTSTLLLDVLFRMDKKDTARIWGNRLRKECKRCKKHIEFIYWRGRIAESRRSYARARAAYFRAHRLAPKALAPVAGLARISFLTQQKKNTATYSKLAFAAKAKSLIDRISFMEMLQTLKKYDQVLTVADPVLKEHPLDSWVHRLAGRARLHKRQFEMSEKHFRTALSVREKDYEAIEGLGAVFYEQEKFDKALKYFNKVLGPEPDNASVLYRVGRIKYQQVKFKEALRAFKKSIGSNDKMADAHYYLGLTYQALKGKRASESIKDAFEKAVELDSGNRVYLYRLARFYYKNSQNRNARSIYTKMLNAPNQTKAEKAQVYLERGKLFYEEQSWGKALKDFRTFSKMVPDSADGLLWSANVYREMRRKGSAIRWYKKAIKQLRQKKPSKDDPADAVRWKKYKSMMTEIYGTLGNYYRDSPRTSGLAIRYLRRAVYFSPKAYQHHRSLGYLFKERKSWGSCRRHLKSYLRHAPQKRLIDREEVLSDIRACR